MLNVREIVKALNLYQNQLGKYPTYDGTITGNDSMSQELKNEKTIPAVPSDPLPPIPTNINPKTEQILR